MKSTKHTLAYYAVNGITFYRVIAAPVLLVLLFAGQYVLFTWLLGVSFFTDLIDGYLARKYKVSSVAGTKLDSIGDDLTVVVAIIALFKMEPAFIKQQVVIIILILSLFVIQTVYALIRYGRITSFHTYLAKIAAILQGVFFLLFFFMGQPIMLLFYTMVIVTGIDLIEEIILVNILPQWQTNVKGLYWVLKNKRKE